MLKERTIIFRGRLCKGLEDECFWGCKCAKEGLSSAQACNK